MRISSHRISVHNTVDSTYTDPELEIVIDQIDDKVERFVEALQTEYPQLIISWVS